ncbi:hypothetical protein [Catellatospora sichuanensis]|uniref:hypothetical protein n=1 Tax=Catellatospora sichuanensis TaxID=1969805 RepID=UPI00118233CD|nr:hypothetical protein [Catellatospora sichuanensis]
METWVVLILGGLLVLVVVGFAADHRRIERAGRRRQPDHTVHSVSDGMGYYGSGSDEDRPARDGDSGGGWGGGSGDSGGGGGDSGGGGGS